MLAYFSLLVLVCFFPFNCFGNTVKPTHVNSTGEYYIANATLSFRDQTIECNSSLSNNCYVICDGSCWWVDITCSSDNCHIECSNYQSCQYMHINTIYANDVTLMCTGGEYSCRGMRFIGPNHNNSVNTSVYIKCEGSGGCVGAHITSLSNNSSVICGGDACYIAHITCSSNNCYIECNNEKSCEQMDLNTIHANNVTLLCTDTESCWNMQFIGPNHNKSVNISVYIKCEGSSSCERIDIASPSYHDVVNIVRIDCHGYSACSSAVINTQGNTQLSLNCVGHGSCWNKLYISSLTNHTNLNCNVDDVCNFYIYLFGNDYQTNFIHSIVNGTTNFSNVEDMRCIDQYQSIIHCTNYTVFPIVDIIDTATSMNETGIYYIVNHSYEYKYRQIMLEECQSNYYIYCIHDFSCSYMMIQFNPHCNQTNLYLIVDAYYALEGSAIVSDSSDNNDNNSITMHCDGHASCKYSNIYGSYVNQLYINCNTSQYGSCDALKIKNIYNIDNLSVNNDYYITIQSSLDDYSPIDFQLWADHYTILNAQNVSLLNITFPKNDTLFPIDIHGPINDENSSNNNIFNLICVNEGCWRQELYLMNGLNDVNVIFEGDCTCNSTSQCIDQWEIYCGEDYDDLWYFDGNSCSDIHDYGTTCCNDKNVKEIQESFQNYWFNNISNESECDIKPHPNAGNNNTNYLMFACISGGSLLIIICIIIIIFIVYWDRKSKNQSEKSEYEQIN